MGAKRAIVERYLACLRDADEEGIDEIFAPDAKVHSPLYGARSARPFFSELFQVTRRSEIELLDVFVQSTAGDRVAAQFRYEWTLASGEVSTLHCVDLFRLQRDGTWFSRRRRIAELIIIYDTYDAREKHARTKEQHGREEQNSVG